jgi:acylpyruvate hydrolase
VSDPHNLRVSLKINGKTVQDGSTGDMMWVLLAQRSIEAILLVSRHSFRIPQLIEHTTSIMTLEEGDLLLTGTPEGVGPVKYVWLNFEQLHAADIF